MQDEQRTTHGHTTFRRAKASKAADNGLVGEGKGLSGRRMKWHQPPESATSRRPVSVEAGPPI